MVKSAFRFALWAAQADRLARALRPDSVAVFMYHGLATDPDELRRRDRVAPDELERQILWVRTHMEIRRLRGWLDAPLGGRSRPGAAITFDDGFRSVLTLARPILERHECPATVFLCPGLIDRGELPWFERLYRILSVAGRAREFESISASLKTLPNDARERVIDRLRAEAGAAERGESDDDRLLTWEEIGSLGGGSLIDFGAHTMSHRILSHLPPEEQREEIGASRVEIVRRAGSCELFAYPNGRSGDFTEETVDIVREEGFAGAVTALPGLVRQGVDRFRIPRIAVGPKAGRAHFALRASGLIGEPS
jgi:peptidoglycan/xylan/chitin deacetylase (PgdA/CDA1 family)